MDQQDFGMLHDFDGQAASSSTVFTHRAPHFASSDAGPDAHDSPMLGLTPGATASLAERRSDAGGDAPKPDGAVYEAMSIFDQGPSDPDRTATDAFGQSKHPFAPSHDQAGLIGTEALDPMTLDALLASIVASPASDGESRRAPQAAPFQADAQTTATRRSRAGSVSSTRSSRKRNLDGDHPAAHSSPMFASYSSSSAAAPSSHQQQPHQQPPQQVVRPPSRTSTQQQQPGPANNEALQQVLGSLAPETQQMLLAALLSSHVPTLQNLVSSATASSASSGAPAAATIASAAAQQLRKQGVPPSFQRAFASPSSQQAQHQSREQQQQRGEGGAVAPAAMDRGYGSQPTSPLGVFGPNFQTSNQFTQLQNHTTPTISPAMTPASAFSLNSSTSPAWTAGGFSTDPMSSATTPSLAFPHGAGSNHGGTGSKIPQVPGGGHPADFFSPLTSPALRPQGYDPQAVDAQASTIDVPALQPLIDQAAALGLSSPFPYQILSSVGPSPQQVPSQQTQQQQPMTEQQLVHHFALASAQRAYAQVQAAAANGSPGGGAATSGAMFAAGVTSSPQQAATKSSRSAARSRASVGGSGKTRPSPLMRPSDARSGPRSSLPTPSVSGTPEHAEQEGPKEAKRAKSVASGSGGASPVVAMAGTSTYAPHLFQQHPYQQQPQQQHSSSGGKASGSSKDSPSPVDLSGAQQPTFAPSSSSMMPPPSLPFGTIGATVRHLAPVTPASIMNIGTSVDGGLSGFAPMPTALPPSAMQSTPMAGQSSMTAAQDMLARIAARPHYLDGRGKDFISTASKSAGSSRGGGGGAGADGPPEQKRSSHKLAEQKRRDALRTCLEDMRRILPPIHWSDEDESERRPGEGNVGGQRGTSFDPDNPNKGISKVALLRRSNEYMLLLHERIKRRDGAIELLAESMTRLEGLVAREEAFAQGVDFGLVGEVLRMMEQERVEDAEQRRKAAEQFERGDSDDEDDGATSSARDAGRGANLGGNGGGSRKKKKGSASATPAAGGQKPAGGRSAQTSPVLNGRGSTVATRGKKRASGEGEDE